jgi:ribonucleoside-diphosphate reductase alpha chain
MRAVKQKKNYELVNPRTGKVVKKLSACWVWNLIAENAWKTGDPGVIFIDEINKHNPTPEWKIESTNPCGEFLGLPYESCNLGSINLTKILVEKNGKYRIDWNKLRKIVRLGVHFLDNVIDANKFPLPEIEKVTKANRKIGLGVMGFAEFLILLGIKYDSEEALKIGEKVMRFISAESKKASAEIAAKKGSFPNIEKSVWKGKVMRNATTTAIAPTGSISIIAGCSSGIEPLFSVCFVRNVLGEKRLLEINPIFEKISKERGFYSADLLIQIAKNGSVRNVDIPDDVKRVFVTALEIDPSWHIRMQAAFQKWTDNAVSKTINLPSTATKEDVRKAFELAHKLKCKGITVYRYGSKPKQVLSLGAVEKGGEKFVLAEHDYSGGCLKRVCPRP